MRIYGFLFSLMVTTLLCKCTAQSNGPVSKLMSSLAANTAEVSEKINLQLRTKLERTADTIRGDMEVILAQAMDQLSAPIFEANNRITSTNCTSRWSMSEFMQRIDRQMSTCTQDMSRILENFERDAASITGAVQIYMRDIRNLPAVCLSTDQSFSSSTLCFVEQIADINRNIGEELLRASMTEMRARQESRTSGTNAGRCTTRAVDEVLSLLDQTLANC